MADSIIRRHLHSRDGYLALLEFNGMGGIDMNDGLSPKRRYYDCLRRPPQDRPFSHPNDTNSNESALSCEHNV